MARRLTAPSAEKGGTTISDDLLGPIRMGAFSPSYSKVVEFESLSWHGSTHFSNDGSTFTRRFLTLEAWEFLEAVESRFLGGLKTIDRKNAFPHDSPMTSKTFTMEVNGYVCEIMCGYIPFSLKKAFTEHLLSKEAGHDRPQWVLKQNPNYVNPGRIQSIWYENDAFMGEVAMRVACAWNSYRDIHDIFHGIGFGTGKDGIGLFDIQVKENERLFMEFVPFDPQGELDHPLLSLDEIAAIRPPAPSPPGRRQGLVAVSGGSWAKGTLRFRLNVERAFDPGALALVVLDLTNLGVGEEHFVSEIRYRGQSLESEVIREIEREMYPVSWYSHEKSRWLPMYDHH